jgi:hypothetical protein
MFGTTTFGSLKYREIRGSKVAYIDEATATRLCSTMATRHRSTCGAM